jgi:hypothetical protein
MTKHESAIASRFAYFAKIGRPATLDFCNTIHLITDITADGRPCGNGPGGGSRAATRSTFKPHAAQSEPRLGCNAVHDGFITSTVDYLDRLFDR